MKKWKALWIPALILCLLAGCGQKGSEWNEQGQLYYEEGDFEKAKQAFSLAVAENQEDAGYYANLGLACIELKEYDAAIAAFRSALALDDMNPYVYRGEGLLFFKQESYSQAVQAFSAAENLAEKNAALLEDIRKYKAEAQIRAKSYVDAVYTYQSLLEKDNRDPELWYLYGRSLLLAGEKNYAVQAFEEMEKLGIKDVSVYFDVWAFLDEQGYPDDAKVWLRKASILEGTDKTIRAHRAHAYFLLENYAKCVQELEALGTDISLEDTTYLAVSYQNLGRGDEAIDLFRKLKEKEPDNGKLDEYIAEYYLIREDYTNALSSVKEGQKKMSGAERKTLDYYEAVCYEYLHEYARALSCFEAYEAAYGSDEKVTHEILFLRTR